VRTGQPLSIAWPNFLDWQEQNQVFEHLGVYRSTVVNLTGGDQPERLIGSLASSEVFKDVGLEAIVGRTFAADEDRPGPPRVAVARARLGRPHFAADPAAVSKTIVLDGETHTIVGVMPAGMRFPTRTTDVWLPLGPFVPTFPTDRGAHPGLFSIAKLKAGVSVGRAVSDMDAIARRLETQYPLSNTDHTVSVEPYYEQIVQNIRPALLALSGAVAFVLLIGCANLANLLLARADGRQREIAIREALGASRRRIFQQMLTESLLMSVIGGAVGVLLAWWSVRAFVASGPITVPRINQIAVDVRVLAFAAAVSIATGVAFGLAPAMRASSVDLLTSLKDAGRGSAGAGRRLRSILVVAEVALALVLLSGAGLTIRSFAALSAIDLGFQPAHVATMRVSLPTARYPEIERWSTFHRELLRRAFTERDTAGAAPVAVVEEALVRKFFPDADPIGKRIAFEFTGHGPGAQPIRREIVGVVGHVRHYGLVREPANVEVYARSNSCRCGSAIRRPTMTLFARTALPPEELVASIREAVTSLDRDVPVFSVQPMETYVDQATEQSRLNMTLLGLFGAHALVLSSLGIYGVLSYIVSGRTQEIGIRMALGATRGDVLRLIVGYGMVLTVTGTAIGLAASWAITRSLSNLLVGVSPHDPGTFAGIALLLVAVASIASYLPGRRATRVDPMITLRAE
jgi:ABC-type antimicrobial peptide transport system permease subunit